MDVAQQKGPKQRPLGHGSSERMAGEAQGRAGGLDHRQICRLVVSEDDSETGHAFRTDHAHFETVFGLGRGDNGGHARRQEVDLRDASIGSFKNLPLHKRDFLKVHFQHGTVLMGEP